MPRNSTGTYTLPVGAFSPNQTIKSADTNSNNNDISNALTQSLATTGVSTMTGPILGASGTSSAPGYTFGSSKTDGLYLAGTHQIGLATNGTQVVTFNSDQSVTWAGAATWGGAVTFSSTSTFTGAVTLNATTYTFGAGAANGLWTGLSSTVGIVFDIDGGGTTPSTGVKGFLEIPFACTIIRATICADVSGSAVVDIWRANGAVPTVANTITASDLPTLSGAQYATDTTLTGWTKTLAQRDILAFNLNSVTTCTKITVSLLCTRTGN